MEWLLTWFEAHPGTASWAQAFGTIVALAIAFAVPFQQNRMMRKEASIRSHEQAVQLFDAMGAIADHASERLLAFYQLATGEDRYEFLMNTYRSDALASVAVEFDRYPVYQLPDHQSVSTALEIKAAFARAWSQMNLAATMVKSGRLPEHHEAVTQYLAELKQYSELLESFGRQVIEYRVRIGKP